MSHYVIDCCIVYRIVKYVPTTSFYCLSFSTFLCLFNFFTTWLIVACPHQFIPIHLSTFLLSSPSALCTIGQTVCLHIGGFIPSFFYYCNIHSFIPAIPPTQSTFLSSFLRVQCILYIENIPRQVMISSFKVRHQQHLHRHQHWSVVGTWTTVSSTDKIPMRGYRHDIVYRLHPTHRSPSHYPAQVSLVDIPSYWSIYQ